MPRRMYPVHPRFNDPPLNYSYFFNIPVCLYLPHSHAAQQGPWLFCLAYLKVALVTVCGSDVCAECVPTPVQSVCLHAIGLLPTKRISESETLVLLPKTGGCRAFFFFSLWMFACVCFCAVYLHMFSSCCRVISTFSVKTNTHLSCPGASVLIITCHSKRTLPLSLLWNDGSQLY